MAQLKRAPARAGRGVDPRRRQWIYDGLAMPPGVAVVEAHRPHRRAERVLLAGGAVAQGIAPPLERLARDGRIELHIVSRPSFTAADWLRRGWFDVRMRPDVTLLALEPSPQLVPLQAHLELQGSRTMWLSRSAYPEPFMVVQPPPWSDRMGATAASYAAWAALVWRMIR